jgi:O-methyltransferase involved in polyketide biosynthesis
MSAPQIPHLSTLLGTRGRGRGRGRRRSHGGASNERLDPNSTIRSTLDPDAIIRGTDVTALEARINASKAGLLRDPFSIHLFPKNKPLLRQMPIINRGTYVRTAAIDLLIYSFLAQDKSEKKQIISLGAGSDPRYFRLVADDPTLKLKYFEFDLPENAMSKARAIMESPELKEVWFKHLKEMQDDFENIKWDEKSLVSKSLGIHALDIRKLASSDAGDEKVVEEAFQDVEAGVPTVILSECCLCYLEPAAASKILETITTKLLSPTTPCGVIIYEPILPNDVFGKRMTTNLLSRNITMPTLESYPSLSSQRLRLKDTGFVSIQGAGDCNFIWKSWISNEEKDRVNRCEMLDEVEEWDLLAGHYCVAWGAREPKQEPKGGDGTVLKHSDAPRSPVKRILTDPCVTTEEQTVQYRLFARAWSSFASD